MHVFFNIKHSPTKSKYTMDTHNQTNSSHILCSKFLLFHSAFRIRHVMLTIFGKKERLFKLSSVMSNMLVRFSLSCNGSVSIDHCNEHPVCPQPCLMARGVAVELSFM